MAHQKVTNTARKNTKRGQHSKNDTTLATSTAFSDWTLSNWIGLNYWLESYHYAILRRHSPTQSLRSNSELPCQPHVEVDGSLIGILESSWVSQYSPRISCPSLQQSRFFRQKKIKEFLQFFERTFWLKVSTRVVAHRSEHQGYKSNTLSTMSSTVSRFKSLPPGKEKCPTAVLLPSSIASLTAVSLCDSTIVRGPGWSWGIAYQP